MRTAEEQEVLDKLLTEFNLTPDTTWVRYTSKRHLEEVGGKWFLKARKEPVEMVVDRYHGFWAVFNATNIGEGLSFLSGPEEEYESDDRICVKVQLKEILDQGGLVYTVTSLPSYITAFFCTLPRGRVAVDLS